MDSTFLPTNISGDYTLTYVLAGLTVVLLIVAMLTVKFGNSTVIPFSALGLSLITGVFAVPIAFVIAEDNASIKNDTNLVHNVLEVYDIDNIELGRSGTMDDGTPKIKATVYKGDTAYEVVIVQNENTFEPNLISYENKEHVRELKK